MCLLFWNIFVCFCTNLINSFSENSFKKGNSYIFPLPIAVCRITKYFRVNVACFTDKVSWYFFSTLSRLFVFVSTFWFDFVKPITTRTEDEWIDGVAPDCETQWTQLCDIANWKLKTIHKKLIKWQRTANCNDIDLESKAAWSKCMCLTIRYNDTVFTENPQTHRWPISKHNTMPFSYRFDHYILKILW